MRLKKDKPLSKHSKGYHHWPTRVVSGCGPGVIVLAIYVSTICGNLMSPDDNFALEIPTFDTPGHARQV